MRNLIIALCLILSDGMGRTGIYIALDIMLQKMTKMNTIDVYECVKKMCAQRPFMVQSLVQILLCRVHGK